MSGNELIQRRVTAFGGWEVEDVCKLTEARHFTQTFLSLTPAAGPAFPLEASWIQILEPSEFAGARCKRLSRDRIRVPLVYHVHRCTTILAKPCSFSVR